MKRFICCVISIIILLSLCSCKSVSKESSNGIDTPVETAFVSTDNQLLGSWEMNFNERITVLVFSNNTNGQFVRDDGIEFPFSYKILNSHQIEQTMVTIDGVEDTSVYEYEINGDKLIFDGMEYNRK